MDSDGNVRYLELKPWFSLIRITLLWKTQKKPSLSVFVPKRRRLSNVTELASTSTGVTPTKRLPATFKWSQVSTKVSFFSFSLSFFLFLLSLCFSFLSSIFLSFLPFLCVQIQALSCLSPTYMYKVFKETFLNVSRFRFFSLWHIHRWAISLSRQN